MQSQNVKVASGILNLLALHDEQTVALVQLEQVYWHGEHNLTYVGVV